MNALNKIPFIMIMLFSLTSCSMFDKDGSICDESKIICDQPNGTSYSTEENRKWDFSKSTMLTLHGSKPKDMRIKVVMRFAADATEDCSWTSIQQGSDVLIRHKNAFVFIIPAGQTSYKIRAPLSMTEKNSPCVWHNLGTVIKAGDPSGYYSLEAYQYMLEENFSAAYNTSILEWRYKNKKKEDLEFIQAFGLDVLPKKMQTTCQQVTSYTRNDNNNPKFIPKVSAKFLFCKYDNQRWEILHLNDQFITQNHEYELNISLSKDIQCMNCLKNSTMKEFKEPFFPLEIEY